MAGSSTSTQTSSGPSGSSTGTSSGPGGGATGIASKYPGDVGIENDPNVVRAENFEEGLVDAVTARYDDFKNPPGMTLLGDIPAKSGGSASMRMVAGGGGPDATDSYKNLGDGYDEVSSATT